MFPKKTHFIYPTILLLSLLTTSNLFSRETPDKNKWIAGWKEAAPMQAARTGAAIYASDQYIYMIGGLGLVGNPQSNQAKARTSYLRTTEYARIQPDGTLSKWSAGPSLNTERGYFAVAEHKNYLYAVGGGRGMNGKELLASIERAEIKADGTLGPWRLEKNKLNISRRCVKLAILGNMIYAFGGYGGILLDTVEQAEIKPDGTLDEWLVATDPMTIARYVHSKVTIGEGVYNIGGHSKSGGSGITNVGWSKVDDEGFFEQWQSTSPLNTGRYALTTATHNGYIYAIGGLSGAAHLDTIERAKIVSEGKLSKWSYTTKTPFGLGGAGSVIINDRLYMLGGSDGLRFLNNVFYTGFNQTGELGYWGSSQEHSQDKAKKASHQNNKPPLAHQGVILQHFKQKSYSYIQVREDNNNILWIAAPAKELKIGERISYPNGTLMRGFFSKGLNRRFPYILFVAEARKFN